MPSVFAWQPTLVSSAPVLPELSSEKVRTTLDVEFNSANDVLSLDGVRELLSAHGLLAGGSRLSETEAELLV